MKKKCFVLVVLTVLLCITDLEYVMAATGLSKAEESILEKLNSEVNMNGIVMKIPTSYLNQVENELMKNEVDISKDQAKVINGKIDEALSIVEAMDFDDLADMENSKSIAKLLKLVDEAAAVVEYKVTVDIANYSVHITDPEGDTVHVAQSKINQTGYSLTAAVIVGSVLIAILFTCVIATWRLNRIVSAEAVEGVESSYEA